MSIRPCLASALLLFACSESTDRPGDAGAPMIDSSALDARPDAEQRDASIDSSSDAGVVLATGLPPISGGTLTVIGDQVVVGDADRDMIWVYDLSAEPRLEHRIALAPGSEPGRVVPTSGGAVVVLRGTGRVAHVDLDEGVVTSEVEVCDAPRGVDALDDGRVFVACAGGSLVVSDGTSVTRRFIERGLRDVVAVDELLYVSVFRTAEVLAVNRETLEIVERLRPPSEELAGVPNTAWRMLQHPSGGVLLLHQRSTEAAIEVERDGYSGSPRCGPGGVVDAALSHVEAGTPVALGPTITASVLLVDMAFDRDGLVFASAGAHQLVRTTGIRRISSLSLENPCQNADFDGATGGVPITSVGVVGDRTVAWQLSGELRVISAFNDTFDVLTTGAPIVQDFGRDLFHQGTPSFVACASCHAEGDDDSITWNFQPTFRRTQTLRGGIIETAPFHWAGDQEDMAAIMQGSFVERMGGFLQTEGETALIAGWIDTLPALTSTAPMDAADVAHGQELFEGEAGCIDCHSGAHFTNNLSVDVGTGGALQVPTLLGISMRGPFLHDGDAATLEQTLDHGEDLTGMDREALVAYLSTL